MDVNVNVYSSVFKIVLLFNRKRMYLLFVIK